MAPRDASVYRCQEGGFTSPKPGTCPDCRRAGGSWVQLVEERSSPSRSTRRGAVAPARPRALQGISMERGDRGRTEVGEPGRGAGGGGGARSPRAVGGGEGR